MRTKILFFCLIVSFSNVFSQNTIGIYENFSYSAKHTVINYSKEIKNFSIGSGISYINSKRIFLGIEEYDLRQKLMPKNFIQHLGLDFLVRYNFTLQNENIELFPFYNVQFNYSDAHTESLLHIADYHDPWKKDTTQIFQVLYNNYNPALNIEQNIGLGLDIKIFKDFFLNYRYGIGLSSFFLLDEKMKYKNNQAFRFSTQFTFGVYYKL